MAAPYGLDIDIFNDQFVHTFNADFHDPSPWDYTPQTDFTSMDTTPASSMGVPVTSLTFLAMPAPDTLSHTMSHVTGGYYSQLETMMTPSTSTSTASSISLVMLAPDATTGGSSVSSIPPAMPTPDTHTMNDTAEGQHFQPEVMNQAQTIVLLMPEPDDADHPLHFCACCEYFFSYSFIVAN